ncbi:M23 family metallopeptidase [Microvirga sp. KLBC 81]|uniref:M23 family metallopeptidase n=1 Tax=Microvirga sp. KLBC 81 TaxID=1862707 RepID=UPI001FDEC4CF|nr:M23 family metallopeptidase [Microvirga sp. KLBC 81]
MSLIGSAAAACSGESLRFSENPFSNPFANSERVAPGTPTASQPAPSYAATPMPTSPVQAQALPPVQAQPLSQPSRVASAPVATPVQQQPRPVAMTPAPAQPKMRLVDQTKVAVNNEPAPVETSRRVRPGMNSSVQQAQAPVAAPAPAPAKSSPMQQVASATNEPLVSPARPVESQKVAAIEPQPVKPAPVATQSVAPAPAPASAPQPEAAKAPVAEPEQTASLSASNFRWPARGRVIAGFGANGGNEGINIAVPEGTPVKAAEAGTVTYAGSEVKGYGNLVLIRHDNGYVSAYAHNGSLSVKRGEQVKRGQVIATSGQTGNVTSPQLHFEIRKGATPVDPMKHLAD